jgi:sulfoxide reductase heme-binding subunit YedZ
MESLGLWNYAGSVPKRAGLLQAAVCVLSLLPALDLWRVLRRMNPAWLTAFDYPVFSLAIAASGAWAFIFLFLALACGPLQRLTRWRWPVEIRRALGLFAFFYALLHLAVYLAIGQKWRFDYAWADAFLQKSRLPGYAALILLIPLALTSTDGMVRRLGGKNWKRLHLLVFPATALALWHMAWVQSDSGTHDFHRTRNAVVTFLVLIALRLLLMLLKLRKSVATRP